MADEQQADKITVMSKN